MLDLNHPMTQHRFTAAAMDDAIAKRAKSMTLAPTIKRQVLLQECHIRLEEMRQLNVNHFKAAPFIASAIDELENGVQRLANFDVDGASATQAETAGLCPVCKTPLTRVKLDYMSSPEERLSVYCGLCLSIISSARQKLDSSDGFGTWAI